MMLYLAKLQTIDVTNDVSLVLLVYKTAENGWSLVPSSTAESVEKMLGEFLCNEAEHLDDSLLSGGLILAEISKTGQVKSVQDATPWFLLLIEQYVSQSLTPDFLISEAKRAEEWRQFLTLQNQDVVRRSLEVETRREQIQELERGLEDKRTKLENMQEELAATQVALQKRQQELEISLQALDAQQQEWSQRKEVLLSELAALEKRKQQLTD